MSFVKWKVCAWLNIGILIVKHVQNHKYDKIDDNTIVNR